MNSERVNDYRHALLCCQVTEALDENEGHDSLLVAEACVDRDVYEVRLDGDRGNQGAMKGRHRRIRVSVWEARVSGSGRKRASYAVLLKVKGLPVRLVVP